MKLIIQNYYTMKKIELLIDNYFGENEFEKIFKYALNIIYKKEYITI